MQDYRNLRVWQMAHQVTLNVYRMTIDFPSDERFGLVSQLRRASSSVPANIAEGSARGSDADFARFIHIAMGSAAELDYHLLLAKDLGYLANDRYEFIRSELTSLRKMLNAFSQKLRTK